MKRILMIVLVAMLATTAFAHPWADDIIRTNPVLDKGLGPESVTPGWELVNLTVNGRDGQTVDRYETRTQGRSGHWTEVALRPGESVESRKTGTRQGISLNGKTYDVETWEAKRIARCGNPIETITFYRWFEIKTKVVTLPAKDVDVNAKVDATVQVEPIKVDSTVKVEPIKVDATVQVAPIKVEADVQLKPIQVDVKVDQSAAPAPQVTVNNVTNNFTTSNYASGQMMGQYGSTTNSWALMGVGVSFVEPTQINIDNKNINNNSNSNTNVNANTNVVNIGDGSATGTTDADGNSAATSGR